MDILETPRCITGTAATVCALLGATPGEGADAPLDAVLAGAQAAFGAPRADRVFLYNPDAVALWLFCKRRELFASMLALQPLGVPLRSVVPPVTPVCFASMYSGLAPAQHGIQKYEKPVLTCDTMFDDVPKAGLHAAIVCTAGDSIAEIFKGRDVDYFIYKTKEECNAKALELIAQDAHALVVLYNGDYDHWMHRFGTEGARALRALDENVHTYCALHEALRAHWGAHNTALVFAPDHGCHTGPLWLGTHGIDAACDMDIMHFYTFLPRMDDAKGGAR